tara:strand:+ start:2186 stop:2326 length:141 start_codon:yes stop_codon:yes gene_type:complete
MIDEKSELITEIETFLAITAKREMFTSAEIQNLLLDLINLADYNSN